MDLEYIVYILGIIACVLIIERTIKNFKLLNDKFYLVLRYAPMYVV